MNAILTIVRYTVLEILRNRCAILEAAHEPNTAIIGPDSSAYKRVAKG